MSFSDLRNLTARAVVRLGDKFHSLDRRIDAYRDEPVQDWRAHDLVICAIDWLAITPSQVPDVAQEWREPSHSEFRPRSLFNAFTEVYKSQSPNIYEANFRLEEAQDPGSNQVNERDLPPSSPCTPSNPARQVPKDAGVRNTPLSPPLRSPQRRPQAPHAKSKFLAMLLKRTRTRCTTCHVSCQGEVWKTRSDPQEVHLKKFCPEHGEHSVCISSDARFYWLAQGNPANANANAGDCCDSCGCGQTGTLGKNAPGRQDGPFEKLSTCLALIEIVDSCNLSCPTCYADSPLGQGRRVDARPLAEIQARIQGVIDRKGAIEILQLSGGEPTLHPEFFELVEWVQANPDIDYLLINTNGVRLAKDREFLERLQGTMQYGHIQLYLQFDGVTEPSQLILRDADLRALKTEAIERCRDISLPLTLAMTVIPENLGELWQTIEYGLQYQNVRGISFQPMFTSGRLPGQPSDRRLNTADIILSAVGGSGGTLKFEDFTPLPCGDPNCSTIGYLLKIGGQIRSVSDFIDFAQVQDFLRDKVNYSLDDLSQCGCDNQPLGEVLKQFELDETHTFRLFIKPFMDAHSWDDDRIDRCCTHVIRPDGKLDSFCRYYSGFADCAPSP